MSGLPVAHVGGIPIEETLALYGPALLLAAGAATATLRARLRRLRERRRAPGTGKERRTVAADTSSLG